MTKIITFFTVIVGIVANELMGKCAKYPGSPLYTLSPSLIFIYDMD